MDRGLRNSPGPSPRLPIERTNSPVSLKIRTRWSRRSMIATAPSESRAMPRTL